MKKIPAIDAQWKGLLPGKFLGDIYQANNIDLEIQPGKVALPLRPIILIDSSDITMGLPLHALRTDADTTDRWWVLTDGGMIKVPSTSPFGAYVADALSNSPATPLDMVVHEKNNGNDRLLVTRAQDVAILNRSGANNAWTASWWQGTLGQSALTNNVPHPIEKFQRLVALGDDYQIHTIDKDDNVTYGRLQANQRLSVRCIYVSTNRFWFYFTNKFGGKGMIAEWDSFSDKFNGEYELEGIPLAGFVYKNTPFVILDSGVIMQFNGNGFEYFTEFPLYMERLRFNSEAIKTHGIVVDGDYVHMNVSMGLNNTSYRMRSGVWVLNIKTGNIYPRWSLGNHKVVNTDIDFGQTMTNAAGMLINPFQNGDAFLIGSQPFADVSSAGSSALYYPFGVINHRGYIVTNPMATSEVDEFWSTLWLRFRKFDNANNKIVAKYRISEGLFQSNSTITRPQCTVLWTGATTFTGVLPTGIAVGNEVEIMAGDNSSCCFHIKTLSATPNGIATITVTIDETAPYTSSRHAVARFDDWVKITNNNPITSSTIRTQYQTLGSPTALTGPYVQFKIELRGALAELDQLQVDSDVQRDADL